MYHYLQFNHLTVIQTINKNILLTFKINVYVSFAKTNEMDLCRFPFRVVLVGVSVHKIFKNWTVK